MATRCLLSFDDGPREFVTSAVLDTLAEAQVTAVFFAVGERLSWAAGRRLAGRIVAEGHLLGNHCFSHARLVGLPPETIRQELETTQQAIEREGEVRRVFRPPYGAIDARVASIAADLGYDVLLWNVDSLDWRMRSEGAWLEHVKTQIGQAPLETVLLHDIHSSTAQGLGALLSHLSDHPDITLAPSGEWREHAAGLA